MNCKYPFYLIFCINLCFVHIVSAQLKVGNNNKTVTNNTYFEIESTSGTKIVVRKDTAMMGINNTNPKNKLEITHGINGNSGLRFTNLTNTSSAVSSSSVNQKFLSVNSSGDVVLANAVDQIISVSGLASNLVSPISAATFQAGTFENSFSKVDSTVLYLNQTDGTTWVYSASNGGEYKSYVAPSSTAWFMNNTTTDAGNNKTAGVARSGFVTIGTTSALNTGAPLNVIQPSIASLVTLGAFYSPNNNSTGSIMQLVFGQSNSTGNNAEARFIYQGNNATTNRVDFGISGNANPMISYLNNGNVGIGNTSPLYKLDVAGKGRFTDSLFGTKAQFNNLASGASTDSIVTIDASGNLKKRNANVFENNWLKKTQNTAATSNTDTIYQMGFVGVQTSTPSFPLEVMGTNILDGIAIGNSSLGSSFRSKISAQGSGANDRWMKFNSDWSSISNNSRAFGFFRGTNEYLTILDNGNIGIGNASPLYKLDVTGKGRFTDSLIGTKAQFNNLASGASTDSIVTIDANGNLKRKNANSFSNNWFSRTTNTSATTNTENIYQMGSVGIGTASPIGKFVVNDSSFIGSLPSSTANLMDNTTYRTLSRFQVTSGANNNALSTYATTAAFGMQAHNYSTGNSLRLILQPIGGSIGIGSDQPIGQLANHGTNYIASIGTGVVGNNFSWSSALGGTMVTLYNSGTQGNATTLLVGSAGTTTNSLFEASTGVNSSSIPTRNIFIVKGNGNIGIHKSSPTQQLQLGNSGSLTVNKTYNGTTDEGLSLVHYINTGTENGNNFSRVADIVVASPTSASAGAGVLRFLTSTNAEAGGNIAEKMRIHSNGNVGIGASNPTSTLHVNNSLFATNTVNADAQVLRLSRSQTTSVKWDNIAQFNLGSYSSSTESATTRLDLNLSDGAGTGTSNVMTWQANGNVGIGTNNPQHRLVVKGLNSQPSTMGVASSNAIFRIEGETNHSIDMGTFNNSPYGGYVQMHNKTSTSTLPYSINPLGGNVGIGIVNPSETLTVTNTQNPADIGIYASVSLPTASDMITSQIKLGPSKDWHTTIRNVLPSGAIGSDISDLQITTGQASNNNTQVSRLTVKAVSGNVGIGTNAPASKLEVNGSATNTTAFNAAAGTSIDFSKSNLAYTSASAGAFTLTNIKDGGTYTLAVQGATSGTSTFSASGFTFKSVNNGATTASKHTLYTFVVMGTNVYFYMATGF